MDENPAEMLPSKPKCLHLSQSSAMHTYDWLLWEVHTSHGTACCEQEEIYL